MRILFHADVDLSLPGGLETHVRELALALTRRGHEVVIFGRPECLAPLTMTRSPDPDGFDVVHLHGTGAAPAGSAGLTRTLHFCVAAKMESYVRLGRMRTLANLPNWRAVRDERAAARSRGELIAVSRRVRDDFTRWHGLDPVRATIVSNGATFAAPRASREELRAAAGIPADARVLLTIGREDFVKGHDLLRRAWERAGAARSGAVWVAVGGRGPARAPGRVVTGPLPHQGVVDWIHAADLGALPSHYEGCSVALLEMLAGGLYTLAHDVGNAAEVIRGGRNGAIVERSIEAWSASLQAALVRPPARSRPGLTDEFRWDAIAERTEAVYARAVAAGSR
jgi:glycosyltransferase involved in cell wall biosynthesis